MTHKLCYFCELFHLRFKCFYKFSFFSFLGISTNDLYFHVYLLEGVVQWNKARSVAVDEGSPLQRYANCLSQKFLGCKLAEDHSSPGEYTGNALHVFTICIYS